MSDFGKPQPCRNSCGASIYFDKDSAVGHPSENKLVPLEYVNGIKTDQPHNCHNRKTDTKNTTITATAPQEPNMEQEVIELMNLLISKLELLVKQRTRK